jgi:arylsulfatase A-like enzyme
MSFVVAIFASFACQSRSARAGYVDAILADSPLAYYRLNETAGVNAADAAGANTGTYQAGVALGTAGPRPVDGFSGFSTANIAPTFDASATDFIAMPAGFLPTGGSPRTIEGWFFDNGSGVQTFFSYGPDATGDRVTITAQNGSVAVAVSGHNFGKTGLGLSPGWHHLAAALPDYLNQSNRFRLYVDGAELTGLANLAGSPRTVTSVDSNQRIGRSSGAGAYSGQIDEIAVYDRELSAGDIQRHFLTAQGQNFTKAEFGLQEFTTAARDGVSPAASAAFAGAQLFVRERGNNLEPELEARAFLQFDISSLDSRAIQSATLNLHEFNKLNSNNASNLSIARVLSDWDTSGDDPVFDDAVADEFVFGTNGRDTAGAAVDIDHVIDVTDIVKFWHENPSQNFGFRLALAGMLGERGYQTACVGKWHLGWDWPIEPGQKKLLAGAKDAQATDKQRTAWASIFSQPIAGGPTARGFDSYFGTDVPNWPPFCFIENDRTVGIPSEFLPARLFRNHLASQQGPALAEWELEPILPTLGEKAEAFIAKAAASDRPYFLYLPLTSPHTPLAVNDEWRGKSGLGAYADLVMETDAVVGRVLDAIEASGAADRTLVLFTSDNGCAPYIGVGQLEAQGHYPSGPLRGYKSDVWEGGHRVAFIVRWPGETKAGGVCDQLVHQADLMATLADGAGAELPDDAGEDSFSIRPLLNGPDKAVRQTAVSQSISGLSALREGRWKLIFGPGSGGWTEGGDRQPGQLYDLGADLGETKNLYSAEPERVKQMTALMEKIVSGGRSTPGPTQQNEVPITWNRIR